MTAGYMPPIMTDVTALWVMAHHFGRSLSYIGYGGQGKQVRDLLHVADLCDLLVEQVRSFPRWDGWLGNVSGGQSVSASLCELTGICQEIVGRKIPITSNPINRPSDLRIFVGDNTLLRHRTNWRPRRSVAQIVADIQDWVCQNHESKIKLHHGTAPRQG